MLRIVLPVVAGPVAAADVCPVAAADVRIPIEIIIVVDGDVIVAAPAAVIAPASVYCCTHHHSDAEGDRHSRGIITWWRIGDRRVRIWRRAINHRRVVAGDVNDLRI